MNNNKIKVIAFYLPQFHTIPENNEWWGENFTEWVNVKKARPLFDGHIQPKVPLNNNYYTLTDDDVKIWQSELAQQYGIYGFCYYHYWFNGKLLLEKPMEQMLKNKNITIPFCVSWANAPWTKAWVGDPKKVLIPQTYGGEKDWRSHYDYLKPFFEDSRYIKHDGKPLMVLYMPEDIPNCSTMMKKWNEWAVKDGLGGICFAYQTLGMDINKNKLKDDFDLDIEFQPSYALYEYDRNRHKYLRKIKRTVVKVFGGFFDRVFHYNIADGISPQKKVVRVDYEQLWKKIVTSSPVSPKSVPGAFAKWDNTPRKGNQGIIYDNNTPQIFKKYLSEQIKRTAEDYHTDMLFMYAWNEWAEGGYLEPDEEYGYEYLEAIKKALEENGCL